MTPLKTEGIPDILEPAGNVPPRENPVSRSCRFFLLTAFLLASPVLAQPTFLGGELQVNTSTLGDQRFPDVAGDPAGGFVVVWESDSSPGDDTDGAVLLQRFAVDGTAVASELQVNTYTPGRQRVPAVAVEDGGTTFVVWQSAGSAGSDTSDYSIQGWISSLGGSFQVNTATLNRQRFPDVAAVPGTSDFVVVWQSRDSLSGDNESYSVQMRRFASDGTPYGPELQVNTFVHSYQQYAATAAGPSGEFLVVWESDGSYGTDTAPQSIEGQLFASDGTPLGGELQVNTYTPNAQRRPAVAAGTTGRFLVAWSGSGGGSDTSTTSIRAGLLDTGGTPLGDELQVNSSTPNLQGAPAVLADPLGGFVVVWQSESSAGTDSSYYSVQIQQLDAAGKLVESELQVNTSTYGYQKYPAAAIVGAEQFVVVWESEESAGTDTSFFSVQAQRLRSPRFRPSSIFSDGFESGDWTAWSWAVP